MSKPENPCSRISIISASDEKTDDIMLHSLGIHFALADAYIDIELEETTADTDL